VVFRPIKATGKSEYLKLMRASPEKKMTKEQAVEILRKAWDRHSAATLEQARSVFRNPLLDRETTETERNRHQIHRPTRASRSKNRVFTVREAVALEAIEMLMTDEKSMVSL
jgi:hypothetical protein